MLLVVDLEPGKKPLSWSTRLKIASGAAHGLEYLHCEANPPVIYRDLKSSNILLDNDFNPKLSDFGLAKLGPVGENTHVSTRVMGTYGYCAPEYAMSGKLTLKSDIYSLGVVLLELITGRRAYDNSRKPGEQNLVVWVSLYYLVCLHINFRQLTVPAQIFYTMFFIFYNLYLIDHLNCLFIAVFHVFELSCCTFYKTILLILFHNLHVNLVSRLDHNLIPFAAFGTLIVLFFWL